MDNLREAALRYLEKDTLLHIDMIENIRRGNADILQAGEEGVLLLTTGKEKISMLSVRKAETASAWIESIRPTALFVAHQDFCVNLLREKFGYEVFGECRQAAYLKKEKLPAGDADIRPLQRDDEEVIVKHYGHGGRDYIRDRIDEGVMYGIFMKGTLAGFIGIHEEGSLGILEILPEYRRMGLGSKLESYLTNRMLDWSYTPFCQIFIGNEASIELQKKLGYDISDETLWWLSLPDKK